MATIITDTNTMPTTGQRRTPPPVPRQVSTPGLDRTAQLQTQERQVNTPGLDRNAQLQETPRQVSTPGLDRWQQMQNQPRQVDTPGLDRWQQMQNEPIGQRRMGPPSAADRQFRQQTEAYNTALRVLRRRARRGDVNAAFGQINLLNNAQSEGFFPGGIRSNEQFRADSQEFGTSLNNQAAFLERARDAAASFGSSQTSGEGQPMATTNPEQPMASTQPTTTFTPRISTSLAGTTPTTATFSPFNLNRPWWERA